MARTKVTIVDYGMGNLLSVSNAFEFLGVECAASSDPFIVRSADILVLPGVGSFFKAMERLTASGLSEALKESVLVRKRKILGICLGMQLLAEAGTEDGNCRGLGIIPGKVERFSKAEIGEFKLPHIGFNRVFAPAGSILLGDLASGADFYFVHSYRMLIEDRCGVCGTSNYGVEFMASYERENVFAAQFHPEKSQTNGLKLLRNFLSA
jgi:glutamine amidotransferase